MRNDWCEVIGERNTDRPVGNQDSGMKTEMGQIYESMTFSWKDFRLWILDASMWYDLSRWLDGTLLRLSPLHFQLNFCRIVSKLSLTAIVSIVECRTFLARDMR